KTDNKFHVLNEGDNAVSFNQGMDFIYEVQLSQVYRVEKWIEPIEVRYTGNPTAEDIENLNEIIKDFNNVEGFPGMKIVGRDENVLLVYADKEMLPELLKEYDLNEINLNEIDKGVCQRFSEKGEIVRALIIIESDIDQNYRNSVVLHEIFHMIGFYGHFRDNASIINQAGEPLPKLSPIDTLAFRILYHPEILIGMKYDEMNMYYQEQKRDKFEKDAFRLLF
ncbi:MAG: DUF2927 domain-containing protein, partial [Methanosarcinales archaeon]|nr:DUF2927 domain-containing protein [Methanosarcinales archaeon]